MKSKHILAIVAFILILTTTACSHRPDSLVIISQGQQDKSITTIEGLASFARKGGTASAEIDLTINPDDPSFDAYFPMEIIGSKSMSGNIEVTKPTKGGYFYSSNITPPR